MLDTFLDTQETTCNQFGFKKGQSTILCVFALKQMIVYYKSFSNPVYICYRDASKEFDWIKHWTVRKKTFNEKYVKYSG